MKSYNQTVSHTVEDICIGENALYEWDAEIAVTLEADPGDPSVGWAPGFEVVEIKTEYILVDPLGKRFNLKGKQLERHGVKNIIDKAVEKWVDENLDFLGEQAGEQEQGDYEFAMEQEFDRRREEG